MSQFLGDRPLLRQDGTEVKASEALSGKVVVFYFSAMWCGNCRQFTPKLQRFYQALKEKKVPFEVVLVTRDKENADFLEYFKQHNGPWLAVKFGDELIPKIMEKCKVSVVPALRLVKPDGSVVVEDAMAQVKDKGRDDPLALYEQWKKLSC